MRRILILVTLMASLVGVIGLFLVASPTDIADKDWLKTVSFCSSQEDERTAHDCLEATLRDAIDHNRFQAAAKAVETVTRDNIPFRDICHKVTHGLGDYMLGAYPDYLSMLLDSDVAACQEGMAHGVVEAFGMSGPTDEEWVGFVAACATTILEGPNEGRGCAHGLGHGLYLAQERPVAAELLLRCDDYAVLVDQVAQARFAHGCAYGVAMSEWSGETLGGNAPVADRGPLSADLVSTAVNTCLTVPTLTPSRSGCMSGLGFSLGANLLSVGVPVDAENPLDVPELAARYLTGCNSMPGDDSLNGQCTAQLLQLVAREVYRNAVQYAAFCHALVGFSSDGLTPQRCVLNARMTLGAAQYEELLAADPVLADQAAELAVQDSKR